MKRAFLTAKIVVLLLGLLASVGCGISATALRSTVEAEIRPAVATEARQTAEAETEAAVAGTQTAVAATHVVALLSFHGQFLTAKAGGSGWWLRQEPVLHGCGWFTLQHLGNGKVSLRTCHDRYVTAPRTGGVREDWVVWQESELGDCGQFVLHESSEGVAFETCGGRFLTAGDGGWGPDLSWVIVAETSTVMDWELFIVLRR